MPVARDLGRCDLRLLPSRARDHASRRCRCCAGTSSRRRGCCGRAPRPPRRSAGSGTAWPVPALERVDHVRPRRRRVRRRCRAAAGEQRPESFVGDVGPGASVGRSAWVICPTLSPGSSATTSRRRAAATGNLAFRYGSPCALMTTTGLSSVTSAPVAVSWIGIVLASDAALFASVWNVNVLTLPDAAPAVNVTAPLVSV